jgi:precorrin-3B C17-methyltransferase
VGLGPGSGELLSPQALHALASCRAVAGYGAYLDLLPPELLEGRRLLRSGMRDEMERAGAALDAALAGEPTALVCGGDPGVYALAGLVFELAAARGLSAADPPIEILPGIPALCAAAALLGAPIGHDFACLSLSDLLTPWEVIEKRARCALAGDFALVIHNPRSAARDWQLARVLDLAREARGGAGRLGLVKNACRPGQRVLLSVLEAFDPALADMLSILFVGNSQSFFLPDGQGGLNWEKGARLVTPRGYLAKYGSGTG